MRLLLTHGFHRGQGSQVKLTKFSTPRVSVCDCGVDSWLTLFSTLPPFHATRSSLKKNSGIVHPELRPLHIYVDFDEQVFCCFLFPWNVSHICVRWSRGWFGFMGSGRRGGVTPLKSGKVTLWKCMSTCVNINVLDSHIAQLNWAS